MPPPVMDMTSITAHPAPETLCGERPIEATSIMSPVKQNAAATMAARRPNGLVTRMWRKSVPIRRSTAVEPRHAMKQARAFPASTCARLTGASRRRRNVPVSRS